MHASAINRIKKIQDYSLKELSLTLARYEQDLKTTETLLRNTKTMLKKEQNFIAYQPYNYPHFLFFYKSMTQKLKDLEAAMLETKKCIQDITDEMIENIKQNKILDTLKNKK
jgi:hypothetical protein